MNEREKEIAIECYRDYIEERMSRIDMFDRFLSRIREEQEAVAWLSAEGRLYKVKQRDDAGDGDYYPNQIQLFTTPPAAQYCPRKLEDGGMSSTAVVCGDSSSSDVLIKKIQEAVSPCDCSELVEALNKLISVAERYDSWESFPPNALDAANQVLANHTKRMKEEE